MCATDTLVCRRLCGIGSVVVSSLFASNADGQCRYSAVELPSSCPSAVNGYVSCNELSDEAGWVGYCTWGDRPVRWTAESGVVDLTQYLPADTFSPGRAEGINNLGVVVGTQTVRQPNGRIRHRAFVVEGGAYIRIEPLPGFDHSEANAINNRGRVVGRWGDYANGPQTAYYWENGKLTDLGSELGESSSAFDINDRNQITGYAGNGLFVEQRAFMWSEDEVVIIDPLPGAVQGWGYAINNLGDVAGTSSFDVPSENSYAHGFYWSNGEITDIGTLPGLSISRGLDINDAGQIIGMASNAYLADAEPFLWQHGFIHRLNDLIDIPGEVILGWTRTINNRGQILVDGSQHGQPVVFLLSPIGRVQEDITCDCVVDKYDLNLMFRVWGTDQPVADLNKDGIVDVQDLMQLLAVWNGD